jgi:hypothetical protein
MSTHISDNEIGATGTRSSTTSRRLAAARFVWPDDPLEEYVREKMNLPKRDAAREHI